MSQQNLVDDLKGQFGNVLAMTYRQTEFVELVDSTPPEGGFK